MIDRASAVQSRPKCADFAFSGVCGRKNKSIMKQIIDYHDIWFGLLHVKTRKRPDDMLGDVEGAYTQLIAKAHSKDEFFALIKECVMEYDLIFVEMEDVSTLNQRVSSGKPVAESLLEEAKTLEVYGHVRFGTFHTYEHN